VEPAVVASGHKLHPRHKLELHLSVDNLHNAYLALIKDREDLAEYTSPLVITSLGMALE